jgi:hypothetical protein
MAEQQNCDLLVDRRELFDFRTNAKRTHTRLLNRVASILNESLPKQDLNRVMIKLTTADDRLVGNHRRFVKLSELDEQKQQAADVYLKKFRSMQEGCVTTVVKSSQNRASRQRAWDVSKMDPDMNRAVAVSSQGNQCTGSPIQATNVIPTDENQNVNEVAQQNENDGDVNRNDAQQQQHSRPATSSQRYNGNGLDSHPMHFMAIAVSEHDQVESTKRRKVDYSFNYENGNCNKKASKMICKQSKTWNERTRC